MHTTRFRPPLLVAGCAVALAASMSALSPAAASSGPTDARPGSGPLSAGPLVSGRLAPGSVAQIDALARAKAQRTSAERKVDSALLAADQLRRDRTLGAGTRGAGSAVRVDAHGRTDVVVSGRVDAQLDRQVAGLGGTVRARHPKQGSALVSLPLAAVTELAADPAVRHVGVDLGRVTARQGERRWTALDAPGRKQAHDPVPPSALTGAGQAAVTAAGAPSAAAAGQGSVVSEGDVTHAVAKVRAARKVAGAGITVAVLSDGVDSLADSIASGDLPADTQVLPGQEGSGDEGTAMLEIVHDLAPTADLVFATVDPTPGQFAANIRALREAGADVIVDDVLYFSESPFQDGPIAQAVADVTADGALYFSSAGNEQNVDDGTAGNVEGDFVASGQRVGKFAGDAHDFDPGPGVQVLDPVSADSVGVPAILQWADPLGGAADDYDLYALDANGDVVGFSNTTQDGDDDAFEGFYVPSGTVGLAVMKYSGDDVYLQLTAFRGRFADREGLTAHVSPGVTRGHSAVPAAYSVAAVPAHEAFPRAIAPGVVNPSGPYPDLFTRAQQSEVFTSDGPRRVFFHPDGTPITPGDVSSSGGELRLKPDIAAADGVATSVGGFETFYGTSAAAPHAAAIAALVLSGNPGIGAEEVRDAITSSALDIEQRGYDRDTGHGIVMANRLLARTGATPQPLVRGGAPVVTPAGDGDEYLEPGESASVVVPVTNVGDATAAQVGVQLTTSTPGVTIRPATRRLGSVRPQTTKSSPAFTVTLDESFDPGVPVQLRERVTFVGTYSPQTSTRRVPTGQPSDVVTDVAYTGPAVPIPDDSTVGASIPLQVAGVGRVADLTFSIDGTECSTAAGSTTVGLDHTFDGDLVGTLTGPGGEQVVLFDGAGSSGNNFCRTVFTDAAAKSIQDVFEAPFTGDYRPAQPLAPLQGTDADGTWTFTVVDTAALDTGSVRAFSLHVRGYQQTP